MKKYALLFTSLFVFSLAFVSCDDDDEVITPPEANAGENQVAYEGETVALDATSSTDEDGSSLTYTWTAPEGITLSSTTDAQPTFTAPDVEEDTDFTFTLTVNDGSSSTNASVTSTVLQSDIAYVFNYGSYGNGGASITRFNLETEEATNRFYQKQNSDLSLELISNIQYGYQHNGNYYLMANSNDEVIVVNDQFEQTVDGISDQIIKPRFCIANGDYLYISCWGGDLWTDESVSYIAKFNLTTNTVDQTISLPGGPEGLAIANGKLYAALNYRKSVAVIGLDDDAVSYIETPAVTSYFLKDASDNLYVSLINTYSDPSENPGIGYINTSNSTLEETYFLNGMSSNYASVLSANSDFSKIYVLVSEYGSPSSVHVFDVASGIFNDFVDNIDGGIGVTVNPENNNIYVFGGASVTDAGSVAVYNAEGTELNSFSCGVSPYWISFLDR